MLAPEIAPEIAPHSSTMAAEARQRGRITLAGIRRSLDFSFFLFI